MQPKGLLTESDYIKIARAMFLHIQEQPLPPFFTACEAQHLPLNEGFYSLLLTAIVDIKDRKVSFDSDENFSVWGFLADTSQGKEHFENPELTSTQLKRLEYMERETNLRMRQYQAVQNGLPENVAYNVGFRNGFLTRIIVNGQYGGWRKELMKQMERFALKPEQYLPFYEYCLEELKISFSQKDFSNALPTKREWDNEIAFLENQIEELKKSNTSTMERDWITQTVENIAKNYSMVSRPSIESIIKELKEMESSLNEQRIIMNGEQFLKELTEKREKAQNEFKDQLEIKNSLANSGIDNDEHNQFALLRYESRIQILNKLINISGLKTALSEPDQMAGFVLTNRRGAKIDFIRVLNALYEMKFFSDENNVLTKQIVMERFGQVLGVDLSKYDTDLSQAFMTGNVEQNVRIFQELSKVTENQIIDRLEVKKKR